MRLSTRVHGVLDYLTGAVLLLLPWVLGFGAKGPEGWVLLGLGAGVVAYSLLTDYELGAARKLQMPVHLWMDALGGVLLAASPWLLGFDERVWVPHVAVGLFELAAAAFTDTVPSYDRRRGR